MPDYPASSQKILKEIDDELKKSPSYLNSTSGGLPDNPEAARELQRLELLQSRVSLVIKNLQKRKNPGSEEKESLKYALELLKRINETTRHSETMSLTELMASGRTAIHDYFELREVPDSQYYFTVPQKPQASLPDVLMAIFVIFASRLEKARRNQSRS